MSWQRHLRPSLAGLEVYDVPPSRAPSRLHANECPEPWPEHVRAALAAVVREIELERYPDTSGRSLRRLLGERHGCDPARIVLGNGSDEIISLLLTALGGGGGHLVVPWPTFVMYGHSARVLGMEVREVLLRDDLDLDLAGLREALPGAAICFFARPNNPTASLWSGSAILELIDAFPGTIFVADEAYAAYDPGCSLWQLDRPRNFVLMSTLSKVGLAALRVGYCIADRELAHALDKVRHPYNVSQTSLALAETVLTRFEAEQAQMLEHAIGNRRRLARIFARVRDAEVFPDHGNIVLVRFPSDARAREIHLQLEQAGVLVKDVTRTAKLSGCLRISSGTDADLERVGAALGVAID